MTNKDINTVVWSNAFSCGIKLIDEQHKGLVNLVNDMFSHVTGDDQQEREYLNRVIHEAIRYIRIHFATEEKIMNATKFDDYKEHKQAHDSFILSIAGHVKSVAAGKRYTIMPFAKFLKDWILSHIAVMDKRYFEYFKQIAARKEDGRITINPADLQNAVTAIK